MHLLTLKFLEWDNKFSLVEKMLYWQNWSFGIACACLVPLWYLLFLRELSIGCWYYWLGDERLDCTQCLFRNGSILMGLQTFSYFGYDVWLVEFCPCDVRMNLLGGSVLMELSAYLSFPCLSVLPRFSVHSCAWVTLTWVWMEREALASVSPE